MKNQDYLSEINKLSTSSLMSQLAKRRFENDLKRIIMRLKSQAYEECGFAMNAFDTEDKTQQFFAHMKKYVSLGEGWSEIFNNLKIDKHSNILDIAPGWAPKIELGLQNSGFQGTVTLMDLNKKATQQLIELLSFTKPRFTIKISQKDIFTPHRNHYDLVVGNHIIDDVMLNFFANELGTTLTKIYQDEGEYQKVWRLIDKIITKKDTISRKLAKTFESLVLPNGYLILTNYESNLDILHNFQIPYKNTAAQFQTLQETLCRRQWTPITMKNSVFSSEKFFVLKRPEE